MGDINKGKQVIEGAAVSRFSLPLLVLLPLISCQSISNRTNSEEMVITDPTLTSSQVKTDTSGNGGEFTTPPCVASPSMDQHSEIYGLPQGVDSCQNSAEATSTSIQFPETSNKVIDKWIRYYTNQGRDGFVERAARGEQYKSLIHKILINEGVPPDLYYLALVESGFNVKAHSHKRATGIWQFMRHTGRMYGLRIDGSVDERRDPIKSTIAAARYLKDLYGKFGDWYLAVAAYNAGPGKVARAIRRGGSHDFWQLTSTRFLSRETKNFLPKIIAAMTVAKNQASYGLEMPKGAYSPSYTFFKSVKISQSVHLPDLAKQLNVAYSQLREWNPAIKRDDIANSQSHPLELRLSDEVFPLFDRLRQTRLL